MLDNTLIEKALALTGKSDHAYYVTMHAFCYYLLSPEFIEKYKKENEFAIMDDGFSYNYYAECFGQAIYEYQSGNEQPLIDLLSKTK